MVFEHDYKEYPELTNRQISDFGFSSPHVQYTEDFEATVVKVVDGDTVRLASSSRDFHFPLRLLNIDAPEMNEGGEEAKEWLTKRILGEDVKILIDKNQRVGKYGRLLGRIFHMGMDVSEEMLQLGLVVIFGMKDAHKIPDINKLMKEGMIKNAA